MRNMASAHKRHNTDTHTLGDFSFELVEDLLDRLHVLLQNPGFVGHLCKSSRENSSQVKAQNAVDSMTGEGGLKGEESINMKLHLFFNW